MKKLKVLIVDDEKPAREMLAHTIDWDNTAFEICDYAINGKDALEKYYKHNPDLIITDIQMPRMNGLELIDTIRQNDLEQRFIILSCYEKFSYAREAIRMNVEDYLIKDLITPQDLLSLLLKVQKEIREDVGYKKSKGYSMENDEFLYTLGNTTLKKILFETKGISAKLLNTYRLNIEGNYFVVFSVHLDDYKNKIINKFYDEQEQIKRIVYKSIRKVLAEGYGGECCYLENGDFVILAEVKGSNSQYEIMTQTHEFAYRIQKNLQDENNQISVTIGISREFKSIEDIYERYKEALNVTKYRAFVGKGKVLFYNMALPMITSFNYEVLEGAIAKIKTAIESNNEKIIRDVIHELYGINLSGFIQYNYIREINGHLYDLISNLCSVYRIKYQELFQVNYLPIHELDAYDTVKEISDWFITTFKNIIQRKGAGQKFSRHVKDAIELIEANFMNKISLNEIAEALNLHKVYLSRLFKEETGETITNYIVNIKIEKAKQLMLSTNMKFYEISERIGYSNAQQFYVAFKKYTGKTPKEFKDKEM